MKELQTRSFSPPPYEEIVAVCDVHMPMARFKVLMRSCRLIDHRVKARYTSQGFDPLVIKYLLEPIIKDKEDILVFARALENHRRMAVATYHSHSAYCNKAKKIRQAYKLVDSYKGSANWLKVILELIADTRHIDCGCHYPNSFEPNTQHSKPNFQIP